MFTVLGIVVLSAMKSLKGRPFKPEFSDDRIGIFVPCAREARGEVRALLEAVGPEEVVDHGA
jgi:hypothetical protein